ncbi:hypothetical protein DW908_03565 [Bifidobacterium longum]|nr:hypothetical protein DW908_03565 [Bifidobacterium longum]
MVSNSGWIISRYSVIRTPLQAYRYSQYKQLCPNFLGNSRRVVRPFPRRWPGAWLGSWGPRLRGWGCRRRPCRSRPCLRRP